MDFLYYLFNLILQFIIQTIIANQHKKDISRDDIINLLIDVKMNGETLDSTSVISPLPEYDF